VWVDGRLVISRYPLGDFDDGIQQTLEDVIPTIRYLYHVKIELQDVDGALNGTSDWLTTTLQPLPADQTARLSTSAVLECCGGKYSVHYNLSHSLPVDPSAGNLVH
jgi:hypothetical protein